MAYTITHLAPETRNRIDSFINRLGQEMTGWRESRARCAVAFEARGDEKPARLEPMRGGIVGDARRDPCWA